MLGFCSALVLQEQPQNSLEGLLFHRYSCRMSDRKEQDPSLLRLEENLSYAFPQILLAGASFQITVMEDLIV
jgi:hypothetical protein